MAKLVLSSNEYVRSSNERITCLLSKAGFDVSKKITMIEEPFKNQVTFTQEGAGESEKVQAN